MSDVTQIINAIQQGDPHAAEQLLPLVYDELRRLAGQKMAHEKPGQTLDATALVHEAYIRLVGSGAAAVPADQHWNSRGHFIMAAAEVAKLRIFAGLSVEEAAQTLSISRASAYRQWTFARAWLHAQLHKPTIS